MRQKLQTSDSNSKQSWFVRLFGSWFGLPAWQQIIVALVAGIGCGLLLGPKAHFLQPLGQIFIHAIQMLVVPVVTTAIMNAVLSMQHLDRIKKILLKTLSFYAIMMAVSASLGILVAWGLGIGHAQLGLQQLLPANGQATPPLDLAAALINFVPASAVAAMAGNNVIQILLFSFLFGLAIRFTGPAAKPVQDLIESLAKVVFQFSKIIIGFAPYGIFAIIASVFGEYGWRVLWPLAQFVFAVYLACFLLMAVVFTLGLILQRVPVRFFFKGSLPAILMAFTTSSSAATLPITMKCARDNLKLDPQLAGFLLPLGTSLNLNGLSIYLSVATVFAAQLFGIPLHLPQYLILVVTILLTCVGAAAVPGSALIVMGAVMSSIGIPLTALPLIAGVDRLNDMAQTATNVAGDLFATLSIVRSEKAQET